MKQMKKIITMVVAVMLIAVAVPAFAGVSDWIVEKTGIGFSSNQMNRYAESAQQVVNDLQAAKNAEIARVTEQAAVEKTRLQNALVATEASASVATRVAAIFGLLAGLSLGVVLWTAYKLGKVFFNLFKREKKTETVRTLAI